MSVWMTVARSKYFRFPWSCLLEPPGEEDAQVAREGGQQVHQVEEDGLLDREQLGVLGRADRGAAGGARDQRQLPDHLSDPEVGDDHRVRAVGGRGHHLEDPALHDEEPVPLVALAEHRVARAELEQLTLGEHGPDHLRGLVLEELRVAQERGIDGDVHGGASIIAPAPGRP
jgi:hypothetical protein